MIRLLIHCSLIISASTGVVSAQNATLAEWLKKETGGAVIDVTAAIHGEGAVATNGDIVGLTGLITAEPATVGNQLSQLAGAAVGRSKAANSRYLYIYPLETFADFAKKNTLPEKGVFAGYVLVPTKDSVAFIGAPIAITGSAFSGGKDNLFSNPNALTKPLEATLQWAVPESIRQTWNLDKQPKYIGFSHPLKDVQGATKVLATGAFNWNVYSDENAVAATATNLAHDMAVTGDRTTQPLR